MWSNSIDIYSAHDMLPIVPQRLFQESSGDVMSRRNMIRTVVFGVGILLFIGGIFQGGYTDTLQKAVKICMECIGIG